ncbi:MAG: hypothetical protein LBK44_00725 [Spirochaetales bacterium]|nr:hypothetical protein [Spirochaetales bacterium]
MQILWAFRCNPLRERQLRTSSRNCHRQFRGSELPKVIRCAQPGGRNFVLTKLRGLPPSTQRSGAHVYITTRCLRHALNPHSRLQLWNQTMK